MDNLIAFASSQTSKVTNFVKGKTSDALTGLKEAFADGKAFINRANNNIKQIILPQGDLALPGGGRLSGGTHYLDEVADTGKNVSKIIGEGAEKASGAGSKWKNPDGTIKWPPNNGAVSGTEEIVTMKKGGTFGRIGKDTGRYTAPTGSSPDELALAPGTDLSVYTEYEIIKDIPNVEKAQIAPWFDKPGGGTQMLMPHSIKELIEKGYIIPK